MTLKVDQLAHAMAGVPRQAPIYIKLPDGRLRAVTLVLPTLMGQDGREVKNGERYAITLEAE